MALDMLSMVLSQGYTDETVIGGGALKGKNCVVSNIEEVADGVNVTFQSILDDGTVKTDTVFIPKGTQGEAGVAGKSAYEIWLEAGNTGTEEDFLISLVGEKGADGKSAYQYAQDGGYIGTETEFTTNIARSGVISKELEVERARIDNLTTLQDGSTTGDAELIDARIDKDGNTHVNVGEHIRTVSSQLSSEIDIVSNSLEKNILRPQLIENEEVLADGTVVSRSGYSRTDYIDLCGAKTLHFYDIYTNAYRYVLFDVSKVVISSGLLSQGNMKLDIPDNAQYVMYSCTTNMMKEITIGLPLAEAIKEKTTAKKTIIIDKNAEEVVGEIYNSFYNGMNYAYQNYCDVVVRTGVYDMYQECIDANGADYWDSLASATQSNNGAHIGHDMVVTISPSATIKCHVPYEQCTPYFSPIYVGQGSYTLDGGNFDCKYTRYIVHDDNYSGKEETHIIRNTHMYLDTYSQGDKGYASCIGAGQNGRTKYIVENNYFEGYLQNILGAPSMLIGWHGLSNVQEFDIISSLFVIKDNFLNGWGTIYLSSSSNDNADEQSFAYVSNNRLGANMIIDNTSNNLTVYDWNNQIANPNN